MAGAIHAGGARQRSLLGPLALALALVLGAGAARAAEGAVTHVVRAGDTLWTIARAHGCTIAELEAANHVPGRVVVRGQRLAVPRCRGAASSAVGPTTAAPAAATASPPSAASAAPVSEGIRHRVAKGESLARIAERYGCSPGDLRRRNGLRGSTIHPGMELWIPRGGVGRFEAPIVRGQSVGRPNRGSLVDGKRFPAGKGYFVRRTARSWGTDHAIAYVLHAIEVTRRRHPKVHRLAIGDLSREHGGSLPGHRSHQSGRDVDLGLYYRARPPEVPREFAPGSARNLHLAATWTLLEALLATRDAPGGVEYVFLDYELQRLLYEWALAHGAAKRDLDAVFQYPQGKEKGGTLIQHVPAHHDHLHVRFKCPVGDRGCL